ncbi:hypothetical protein [Streptomyces sp. NPDC015130]|uniref:hypothetical protein n=1 Tax=Streptomyces sp. NPDC015130 TaxID=3364940 RepID=UPI0036FF03ED
MAHDLDPARQQLLARLQAVPRYREADEAFLARRVARMTDQQAAATLALSDAELLEKSEPDRTPRYAPPTDDTPVILYDHVDGG